MQFQIPTRCDSIAAPAAALLSHRAGDGTVLQSAGRTVSATSPALAQLQPGFWHALFKQPYGFTSASIVLTTAAAGALWLSATGAGAHAESPPRWLVQRTDDVVLIDVDSDRKIEASAESTTAQVNTAVFKRTYGHFRLLLVAGSDAAAERKEGSSSSDAAASPAPQAAAEAALRLVSVAPTPDAAAGAQADARLHALLSWLKHAVAVRGPHSSNGTTGSSGSSGSSMWRLQWADGTFTLSPADGTAEGDGAVVTAAAGEGEGEGDGAQGGDGSGSSSRAAKRPRTEPDSAASAASAATGDAGATADVGAATSTATTSTSTTTTAPAVSLLVAPQLIRAMFMGAPSSNSSSSTGAAASGGAGSGGQQQHQHQQQLAGRKRAREEGDATSAAPAASAASAARPAVALAPAGPGVSLAVLVPFRDQPEQNRGEQLRRFSAALPAFLRSPAVSPPLVDFHVFVIEQSQDGYKFNRGKTLNVGYIIASQPDRCARYPQLRSSGGGRSLAGRVFNSFCFHDVDLLPGPVLGPWYAAYPERPIHIGAAWTRYPYPSYVGGILSLSAAGVSATNGFPNNFWGWGGEDDELSLRLKEAALMPLVKPQLPANTGGAGAGAGGGGGGGAGSAGAVVVDLEEVLQKERGGERAGTRLSEGGRTEWRNMWKHEMLALHDATWRVNGVVGCDFTVTGSRAMGPHVTVVTVDLHSARDPHAQKAVHTEPIPENRRPR